MSETVRVYKEITKIRHYQRKKRLKYIFYVVGGIFLSLIIWIWLISKDIYSVSQFIPKTYQFQIFSTQLMQNHPHLAKTSLWKWVPPDSSFQEIRKLLQNEQPLPLWIIRHLIYDFFSFTIEDYHDLKKSVILMRLSRLGCVLEFLFSATQNIERDWAGGLNLCYIPELELYYSRKGRVLILSQDRETLIHTLTQPPHKDDQSSSYNPFVQNSEKPLAWGTAILPWQPLKEIIHPIQFNIGLNKTQLGIKLETEIAPDPDRPWTLLLADLTSKEIQEPPDTDMSLSINTGAPLSVWFNTFETTSLTTLSELSFGTSATNIQLKDWLKYLLNLCENEIYVTLNEFYTDEIIPFIPKFTLIANTSTHQAENAFTQIPNFSIELLGEKTRPFISSNPNEIVIPLLGSTQTDLLFTSAKEQITLTNNPELRSTTLEFLSNPTFTDSGSSAIIKIKPEKLVLGIEQALHELAQSNIIQTQQSKIFTYLDKIKILKNVKIKVGFNKGKIKLTILTELSEE